MSWTLLPPDPRERARRGRRRGPGTVALLLGVVATMGLLAAALDAGPERPGVAVAGAPAPALATLVPSAGAGEGTD